jgi:hypothetical protein
MAVVTTALVTGATITATTVAAGAAMAAGIGAVGQAYSANRAANQQQKMANIQNSRERKMALRSMRMQQRALEAQGVSSGTAGSSGIAGAMGATASSTASAIGYQGSMLANAQQVTHWNNMSTGFGALSQVGSAIYANKEAIGNFLSKSPNTTLLKPSAPAAATINRGSTFGNYA